MKKNILLTLIALLSILYAQAYDFQSGDLYYNITSSTEPYTAEVTYQEQWSEDNYKGLTSVTIPATVTYNGATYTVTSIGYEAFQSCTGLTSVTIPNSVTSIGESAFYGCTGLTSITIPNSVTSIGEYAFYNVPNIVYNGTATGSPWGARSVNGYVDGYLVYADATKTTLLDCSSTATGTITIPNSVTNIGGSAFSACTGLTSITIPNSVTSIGERAFSYCSGLTSIIVESGNTVYDSRGNCNAIIETATNALIQGCKTTVIPNSVTRIGSNAFGGCIGLTSIAIPNSVTSIGSSAFSGCTGLTSITIPNSVTFIGDRAFSNCSNLISATLGDNVTSIEERLFQQCHSLTSVTIGRSVRSIGYKAFVSCKSLSSVSIPNSVTSIGESAFYGCTGLTSITIPNSVTSIGERAFSYCINLTSITIPNSVTNIGDYAFRGCTGLTTVTLGSSVTSIGSSAFWGCTGLTSVTLGNSVTSIGKSAFSDCINLTSITIPNSVTNIGDYAFRGCTGLTSATIGDGVTSIGNSAFSGCTGLFSLTIPNSVTSIGSNAFEQVFHIAYYGTATGSPWGAEKMNGYIDGYLIYADATKTTLWACSTAATGAITIPNTVTSIGSSAFSGCTGLTSIAIPNSVTSIGKYAFAACTGLTSITIPNSVTSIGEYAFSGCAGLTSITIPNSVTSIGDYAFYIVPNIVYNGTATGSPWGARSVNGYVDGYFVYADATKTTLLACSSTATGSISIPNSVTSIGDFAFCDCTGLTSVTIPNSVTSIGDYAFEFCTGLTSITIPNSVTSIGGGAFGGCTGLTTVTIPNSVTSIGGGAFGGCTGLTTVTIPNSVTSIGWYAFEGCTSLTSITIPNSVTSIGGNAFCNTAWFYNQSDGIVYVNKVLYKYKGTMPQNTSIAIEEGTVSISGCAFYDFYDFYDCDGGCYTRTGLTSITIPNSVTSIGDYAFRECTGLTSVTIPENVTSIGDDAFKDVLNIVYNGTATGSPWGARSVNGYVDGYFVYADATKTTLLACSSAARGAIAIPNSVTSIEEQAFYNCDVTSITIPNSVKSIGKSAFAYCDVTSITIPNSVKSIGESAFAYCWQLTSIVWNAKTCSGWSNYSTSPFYSIASQITSFSFGDEVDTIPYAICDNMQHLRSISIPESVRSIGGSAFYGCSGLTSVTIPENVTSIGNYAFRNCSGLKSIQVEAQTPPQCGDNSFYHVFYNVPTDIPIYVPCGTKEAYQAAAIWSIFTNYIETPSYILAVTAQDETMGSVRITQQATCADNTAVFEATANEGYQFVQWSDGNTENPRTIIVDEDITLTAQFVSTPTTIDNTSTDRDMTTPQKVLIDGQVYILHNGKTYTLTGIEVK